MAHTCRMRRLRSMLFSPPLWASIALTAGVALALYAWPFSVDDAFIVARYARRLARAGDYALQSGPNSDGVTGPLWLFLLAIGVMLGCDAVLFGKWLGVTCAVLAFAVLVRASARRAGGSRRAPFLAALCATSAPLWIWAIGGLETAPATLCATAMLFACVARPPQRWTVAICAALLPWLRPELSPLGLFALAVVALRARWRALGPALLGAGGLLAVLAFRCALFGHLLPLSAHAKPASLAHGLGYLLTCLRAPAALSLAPLLVLAARGARGRDRALLAALSLHAAVVVFAGGDWMAGARLFAPVVPTACFLASRGLERVALRRAWLALALASLVIAVRGVGAWGEAAAARRAGELRARRVPELVAALRGLPDPVAILDIGAVGYAGERQLIDLGGLTEERIAYAPGGHLEKRIDSAWLEARAPGAIVLHSRLAPRVDARDRVRWFAGYPVERRVLAMPWVLRDYRVRAVIRYDQNYFYLVLARAPNETP